jgi:hypothetical protein
MILADFTIAVEFETPREVRVIVYDSVKGLRIAASRYDNTTRSRRRRQRGAFGDTLGVCHRFEYQDPDGATKPLCAIVRLAEPHLGVGIISHELGHAAVWMRELAEGETPLTCADDEQFCWVLGELVRQTINSMNERGVYGRDDGDES